MTSLDIRSHRRMPVWQVVEEFRQELRGKERSCLELRCEYCSRDVIVEKTPWYKRTDQNNGLTRPCPYCFRASYMPDAEAQAAKQGWDLSLR
jgi:hypothetical protein